MAFSAKAMHAQKSAQKYKRKDGFRMLLFSPNRKSQELLQKLKCGHSANETLTKNQKKQVVVTKRQWRKKVPPNLKANEIRRNEKNHR